MAIVGAFDLRHEAPQCGARPGWAAGDRRTRQRPTRTIVKAAQALQYLIRDPFGPTRPVTTS
jgi:hypothetical protein